MSREALSLDISRVVSRVVSGEPIDTAENGAALAAKYPDLGMSPALISQAIERAAGMVGMIKSAPEPVKPPRVAMTIATPKAQANGNGHGHTATAKKTEAFAAKKAEAPRIAAAAMPVATMPVAAQSIDDDLAAAIDAEIGYLVAGQTPKPAAASKPVGDTRAAVIQTTAASRAMAATLPKATVETHARLATEEPQLAAAPLPDSAPAADNSAKGHQPRRGSIFSSFRRAIFRT